MHCAHMVNDCRCAFFRVEKGGIHADIVDCMRMHLIRLDSGPTFPSIPPCSLTSLQFFQWAMNPHEYDLKAMEERQQALHPGGILFQHIIYDCQVAAAGNGGRGRMKTGDDLRPSLLNDLLVVPQPFLKRRQIIIYAKMEAGIIDLALKRPGNGALAGAGSSI